MNKLENIWGKKIDANRDVIVKDLCDSQENEESMVSQMFGQWKGMDFLPC